MCRVLFRIAEGTAPVARTSLPLNDINLLLLYRELLLLVYEATHLSFGLE
jgi:hypothetical protein